jgi:hypothetical protein
MLKFYLIIGLVTSVTIISCNQKNQKNSVITVDIERNINNKQPIFISEFASDIKYIALQCSLNHYLHSVMVSDFSKDKTLVSDMSECFIYDSSGNFLSKIGNKGRGPGEYPFVNSAALVQNKIFIKGSWDLFEFNMDGSIIKLHPNTFRINESMFVKSWIIFKDSLIFGHIPNTTGKIETSAIIMNTDGEILYSFPNYDLFQRDIANFGPFESYSHLYYYKKKLFYKALYSDTLYYLSEDLKLTPEFNFYLGRYKESISDRKKRSTDFDRFKYIYVNNVFQTKNFLLIDCNFGYYFTARRLTPLEVPLGTLWYNSRYMLGVFNKNTGRLVFSQPSGTDNSLYTTGLYNDIDGGPKFYPKKVINDSTMVMFVSSLDLKKHISSIEFKQSNPKNLHKKKEFEDFVNNLESCDNPVLMYVYFKN